MSDHIIKDFTITKRINDCGIQFSVTFDTPLAPNTFRTGDSFEFGINDSTLVDTFITVGGIVESVERDEKDHNRIYGLTGQNEGRLLVKQPFKWDCTTASSDNFTIEDIISNILVDTEISVGRGQPTIPL